MKINLGYLITTSFLLAIILTSCTKDENTVNPPSGTMVYSTSFEKNGFFNAEGWTIPSDGDSSSDVPANGGKYSLLLNSSAPPEEYAEIKVPVMTQFNDYKFSFWAKSTGVTNDVYGKAALSLVRNGTLVKTKNITIDNISWQIYSIEDTFIVAENDSLMIQFSAGASQLFPGKTYFDLCNLEAFE